ncbi:hypothetical protein McanMca71_003396 [Microsporum canis]
MFILQQPAIPQPLLSSRQLDVTSICSMMERNTHTSSECRDDSNTNQLNMTPFTFSPSPPADPAATAPTFNSHFAQRYAATIARPAARVTERRSRESRRDAFLNKVKRSRQSAQFEARSDQIQRSDFLEQQKQFNEEMARSAPPLEGVEDDEGEEGEDLYCHAQGEEIDEALLEDFIAQEENEYMGLVEDAPDNYAAEEPLNSDMLYGDVDDDGILVDLLDQIESQSHQEMDMSGS